MNELTLGSFAVSKAGRDSGKCYVIIYIDREYVYLVDGKIRTINHPKRKKIKHINRLNYFDPLLAEKIRNKSVRDEEIKRAIKLLPVVKSSKEVE